MNYQGHVENGVVVFDEPLPLPNGTRVRVEPAAAATSEFWQSNSLDELARVQGVGYPKEDEEVVGGWPEDELDDGFEDALGHCARPS